MPRAEPSGEAYSEFSEMPADLMCAKETWLPMTSLFSQLRVAEWSNRVMPMFSRRVILS